MMFLVIVTLTSMLLAAAMSMIAWRIAGDERRRSDARVAALAAEIHGAGADEAPIAWDLPLTGVQSGRAPDLFVPRSSPRSRSAALFAIGAIVIGGAVASALFLGGKSGPTARTARPATAARGATPLELVALGHQRDGDQLTVRGVVRNPASAAERDRLSAVVFLFTPDGGFLTSGRATIESPALAPGGESTFIVTLPGAATVGRYRVSFRTDDHIVPHVDRRHES